MSKYLILIAKIVVALVLILVVISLISLHDKYILTLKDGEKITSAGLEKEASRFIVVMESGERRAIPRDLVVSDEKIDGLWSILKGARIEYVLLALVLIVLPQALLAFRWWMILRGLGIVVGYGRVFMLNYAGFFFGNFLPGGAGGDLARAVLTAAHTDQKVAAVGTVIVDRLIGLFSLLFMAAVAVSFQLGHWELRPAAVIIYGMLFSFFLGYRLYFSPTIRSSSVVKFVKGILPFFGLLQQADDMFKSIRERKGLIVRCLALSLLCQGMTIVISYILADALMMEKVTMMHMCIFIPIIVVVGALPISPGGIGVSEAAYVYLFSSIGVTPNSALALAMVYRVCLMVASLPGAVTAFFVRRPREATGVVATGAPDA